MGEDARGTLFVISAPSGTGKSTLARRLLESVGELRFSVSYTTRPRRPGEESGREYHFVDDARFDAMTASGAFLEWARVFGHRYGTGREATEAALGAGTDLLLDIDVQGARQVRASGLDCVSIFVLPPDFATLEERLVRRGSDPAVPPLALLEVHHRLQQVLAAEIGPQDVGHPDLGIRDLPEQEVRDAHLAARADQQIRIRLARRVKETGELILVQVLRSKTRR